MRIPNASKGKLIRFFITIEWFEEGKKRHVVLHVREHKKGKYHARISQATVPHSPSIEDNAVF
jgi:hypothetical protein